MESSLLTSKLVYLASRVAQQRFGVEATKEAYLLPEEILEDAWSVIRLVESDKSQQAGISSEVRAEIMKLAPLLEAEKKVDLAGGGGRPYCSRRYGFNFATRRLLLCGPLGSIWMIGRQSLVMAKPGQAVPVSAHGSRS